MATDKRELLLVLRGEDQGAKDVLDDFADSAEDAKDESDDLNKGLKRLDGQMAETARRAAFLRAEIGRSGDLGLVKDLQKAENELRRLGRQRKLLIPVEVDLDQDAGLKSALGFSASFSKKVGPLLARAPISPALIAAGAAAGPGLAGVLSAGIGLGAGLGAVALGAKLSARNPVVAAGLADLKEFIGSELEEAAQPFVPAMLRATERAKTGFRSLRPELDAVFEKSATYLDPLVDGVAEFVQNALPGFGKLVDAAEPLVDMFGKELPELGGDFSYLLESIGAAAANNEDEFQATLDTLGLIVRQTGFWVAHMEYLGSGPLSAILDGLDVAKEKLSQINNPGGGILTDGPPSLKDYLYDVQGLPEPFDLAADAARSFREETQKLINDQLGLEGATINWQAAIDATTESIKENGKTLDINTPKGRANRQSLLDQAEAGLLYADRIYQEKAALGDVAGAEKAAEQAYRDSRAALVASATQMLGSKEKAEDYVTSILGIPPTRNTNADFKGDDEGVRRWKRTLSGIPREIFIKAEFDLINDREVAMALRLGRLSKGGPVEGPGPKGVDSQPYLLAPGEHVLTAKEVDAAGGHTAIEQWRKGLIAPATRPDAALARRPVMSMPSAAAMGSAMVSVNVSGVLVWPDGTVAGRIVSAGVENHEGNRAVMLAIRREVRGSGSGSVQRTFSYDRVGT